MSISLATLALISSSAPQLPAAQAQSISIEPPVSLVLMGSVSPAVIAQAAQDATGAVEAPPAETPSPSENTAASPGDDTTIIVTGEVEAPPGDPLENINLQTFEIAQEVDQAFVEPIANVYEEELPKPVRRGLRNFFRNLLEPVNFLNYMLQLKPGKAFETLGRFTINSTVGIAGIIDVAEKKPFNLPYRRNGFANTLGYYGVGPGPYLYLPLIGSTTLRDLFGTLTDQSVVPFVVGAPFNTPYYAVPAYTVNSLEYRIEFDEYIQDVRDSVDPYAALRETYLCQREADIAALKNRPPPRDCSIEALFAAEDARLAAQAAAAAGTSAVAAPAPEAPPAVEVAREPQAPPVEPVAAEVEPDPALRPGELNHPSLSLEEGCAFLEEGVNTLHVITC